MLRHGPAWPPIVVVAVLLVVLGSGWSRAADRDPRISDQYHQDFRTTPKLLFQPAFSVKGAVSDTTTARRFLEAYHDLLGLPDDPADLPLERIRHSLLGTHFRFQQYLHGYPIEGAEIIVTLNDDRRILMVYNNIYPVDQAPRLPSAFISHEQALQIAWNQLRVHGPLLLREPSSALTWIPVGRCFRLVYATSINVAKPYGRWLHRIDAATGEIVGLRRSEISRTPMAIDRMAIASYEGPVTSLNEARERLRQQLLGKLPALASQKAVVDGTGQVFDPDPRTTLNDETIQDTSDPAVFSPAYITRTLRDITEDGGVFSLDGPWVVITDHDPPATAPSTTSTGDWTASRGNNAFNDAMTYFHIDQSQRYLQSLGFTGSTGVQEGPIAADTDGANGDDNSFYDPGSNTLSFGHGCVDDNEDADVILHEYGHAIQFDINPGWSGGDTGGIGEGFGDYWAGSYSYSTANGATFHPEWVFSWDGHNSCWSGRILNDLQAQYDPTESYPAHAWVNGVLADQLWSTPLFSSMLDLLDSGHTREEVDTVVVQSHFGLGSNLTMRDMANATVAAAEALFPTGPHAAVFSANFASHGILDLPPLTAPTLLFPAGGEQLPPATTVTVFWSRNGADPTAVYTAQYHGHCTPVFADDMEGSPGWSTSHEQGSVDWVLDTTNPYSGSQAWYAADPAATSLYSLTLDSAIATTIGSTLSIWHHYATDEGWDGGVVEGSTNGGSTWFDIGAYATRHGYDDPLTGGPLSGRNSFTGNSGGYVETLIDLSSFSGQNLLIRFRMSTDSMIGGSGWWIDDVTLSQGEWLTIGSSAAGATSLAWTVPSQTGTDYCVRIFGSSPQHSMSDTVTGETFEVSTNVIFLDYFESGDTSRWSATRP